MRILIADHNPLFCDALGGYIEQSGLAQSVVKCADLIAAIDRLSRGEKIDIALIAHDLSGLSHNEDFCDLVRRYADVRFCALGNHFKPDDLNTLVKCGLWGYFPKVMSGRAMIDGLYDIVAGKKFLSRVPRQPAPMNMSTTSLFYPRLTDNTSQHDSFGLTSREQQVLSGLMRGFSNAEIGEQLGIQLVTVKLHMRNLTRKLGARNRTEAALIAQQNGLSSGSQARGTAIHQPNADKPGQ